MAEVTSNSPPSPESVITKTACETATDPLHTQAKVACRAQQLLANSEHNTSEQAFEFVDLSPELRNVVYSHISTTVEERSNHEHLRWVAGPFCSANARLVSHQFKREYKEEMLYHAKLYIVVRWPSLSSSFFFMPPIPNLSHPLLRRLTLEFRIKYNYWEDMEFRRKLNIPSVPMPTPNGADTLP